MHNPVATYRLQFHKAFTFKEFEKILPYLQKLGVSTIYASPIFEATPGSTHGYDGVDPHRINPEIGTEKQLRTISKKLQKEGIQWLQDIVPNHMAYHGNNAWLTDVLEKGQRSAYATFFDIGWNSTVYDGKIMVPFLGAPLEEVIKNGELKLNHSKQGLVLKYYDSTYPLHLRTYATILQGGEANTDRSVKSVLGQVNQALEIDDKEAYNQLSSDIKDAFASLMQEEKAARLLIGAISAINKDTAQLLNICKEQEYRLCHWQETDKKINFRRFFTVNGLICLNIQDKEVFNHYHKYITQLQQEGIFQGLRIDHIDGLYDPSGYLQELRQASGEDTYIVVEKILEPGEEMPSEWPIEGNTGYDFLSLVNNLFTNRKSEKAFTSFYAKLVGDKTNIHEQIRQKKAYILNEHMQGELHNLYQLFSESGLAEEKGKKAPSEANLKAAIGEVLIQCPVYRFYGNQMPLEAVEAHAFQDIIDRCKENKKDLASAFDVLQEALLRKPYDTDEAYNKKALHFYQLLMQFTGPLMAKGVEDTLMYTYNRFAGHNEVGDSPEAFGMSPEEFHQKMKGRQAKWPLSMNGTSTHDTKRGEDVRARLNVLTDLAEEWLETVQEWQQLNKDLKQNGAPDANDEYFIYQTMVGAYAMPQQHEDAYDTRIKEYLSKALREAKLHSNWTTPNSEYEEATASFATRLLDKKRPFWKSFQKFHQKVADWGIVNSLAQVLLKFTTPGVPDVYQGCELWDLSMVDPDNRRPVDYEKRSQWLEEIEQGLENDPEALLKELWQDRYSGRIKLWLTHTLLHERKLQADLFAKGQYIPLQIEGKFKDNVFAFARKMGQSWNIVAVPLHLAALSMDQKKDLQKLDWKDTRIVLPAEAPSSWQNLLSASTGNAEEGILAKDLFQSLPFAILKMQHPVTDRKAGILMHITSLPSPFGVGDLGPEAYNFADFLAGSRQSIWQLLPLNPTEAGNGHSPYSSYSSMAGNPLLISPEELVRDGLLRPEDLKDHIIPSLAKADFKKAEKCKKELFEKAWNNFRKTAKAMQVEFMAYQEKEAYWLDDFALYVALKEEHKGKAWFDWAEEFKTRKKSALQEFTKRTDIDIVLQKVKWLQFLFSRQWQKLKAYCNNANIQLLGDLPIYVSYDSVDVWANPDIFSVDKAGKLTAVAGVPPDFFSESGQLWGMPVFKWDVLKKQNYSWWVARIRKNMELYDQVRLDHFRAFADYWEVPAGEETAIHGKWKTGPGAEFFNTIQKELGCLPFVAEDLGDIDNPVYQLRDEFMLPGMNVLQFAFGDNMPQSVYIPHNYTPISVAYTGTHDNNTTRGWFRKDASAAERKRLEQYLGTKIQEKEVHKIMGRLAYASVSQTAILPIQDVLGLDETARMNMPGSVENNWLWRLEPGQITPEINALLLEWVKVYHR
jgi:malto-oligosyltrehalose synthase/4-alpha-glucanotransferase